MPLLYLFIFIHAFKLTANAHEFTVRDSQTGKVIDVQVSLVEIDKGQLSSHDWQLIKLGKFSLNDNFIKQRLEAQNNKFILAPSLKTQLLSLKANNYSPLITYIEPESNVVLTQINLDRIGTVIHKSTCQNSSICGHIYDKNSIHVLEHVTVELSNNQVRYIATSDSHGFFMFNEEIPDNATLTFSIGGYVSQIWSAIEAKSSFNMVVDLEPGRGVVEYSMHNPLSDVFNNKVNQEWLQDKLHQKASELPPEITERVGGGIFMQPPASIRVGFSSSGGTCCGSNCASSQVYSLESYVQKGLDNEWISSWNAESLKAGSIPFRSYGAWHVLNPPYNGYDICAGPCCQAFGSTSYTTTVNAAKATAGIMLEKNGELARSEYSAQNNSWNDPNDGLSCTNADLSCGDGFVGSPATGWPCLSDSSSTGRGCFGHGRGMSQWGTQYNALAGEGFADIVDFYYNAKNNPLGNRSQYNTSPIRIDAITSSNSTVFANQTFDINFQIFNASSISFGPIILGASLINNNAVYSDSANDDVFTLVQTGATNLTRSFSLSSNVQVGVYDLLTAVYLDVNNDNTITGADWALITFRENNAISIVSLPDLMFVDSFEE